MDAQPLRIGTLARAAGVGIETIRYYQRRKLLGSEARPHRPRAPRDADLQNDPVAARRREREAVAVGHRVGDAQRLERLRLRVHSRIGPVFGVLR